MEHAPLRPVPARPAGPIDPATATRAVAAWLPTLPPESARALALVGVSEWPRPEAAEALGVSERELGELLAAARKELRQTAVTLAGSGWCERAEGLISDRLDGVLSAEADTRRLDVHLRNCSRCVEHERRLVQATDALVGALGGLSGQTVETGRDAPAAPLAEAPPEEVPPQDVPPVEAPPEELPPAEDEPEELPPAGDAPEEMPAADAPELPAADDALRELPAPEDGPAELPAGRVPEELPAADDALKDPPAGEAPLPEVGAPAAVARVPGRDEVVAAAEVLVAVRTRRQLAAAVTWNALIALAVLLVVATIAITVAGILGAEL